MEPGEFLRRQPPFDRLAAADLALADSALEIAYEPRGAVVLRRGGPESRHLYLIRKGRVRLEQTGRVEQVVEAGECFGFPSLIGHASPHADAIADEDCLLYLLPAATFDRLMAAAPFREFFVLDLAERLRRAAAVGEGTGSVSDFAMPARRLGERAAMVRVAADARVGEAAARMTEAGASAVIVDGTSADPALGILTDRDLRGRVLAVGRGPETRVAEVASRPLLSLPAEVTVYEAMVFMLEHRVRHVPLVERGELVGMITEPDLLRLSTRSPLGVQVEGRAPAGPGDYGREIASTVEGLLSGGLEAAQIGRIVARLNDALVARLLREAEADLGPPPSPYAWIVYGSEGRMEQALLTDQDNGLVYSTTNMSDSAAYFATLAARVVAGLSAAGFPECKGGFMATRWCHPLDAWRDLFRGFLERPSAEALLDVSSLFDFRAVHGALDLSPLDQVVRGARERSVFVAHLARTALDFAPPLNAFGQIKETPREDAGGADDGPGVDLKRGGLLPIVGLARVFALEAGDGARSTLDRLAAAARAGTLSAEGATTLGEAFRYLARLRLRAQVADLRRGRVPGNRVRRADLSPLDWRLLRDTFHAVREIQQATALRFHTDRLG